MARPIRETPILFGEEGRRFEEKMRTAKYSISDEEYDTMYKSYKTLLMCLERGEASRKARLTGKQEGV